MPGSDRLGFFVILNKSSELKFGLGRSELIFGPGWCQSSYGLGDARARWLGQWVESWRWTNSQHRKIVSLSPRVENLNLKKVIKVSYLYQESHQCFSDSYANEHSMNITNVLCIMYISHICIWIFWPYVLHIRILSILQIDSNRFLAKFADLIPKFYLCLTIWMISGNLNYSVEEALSKIWYITFCVMSIVVGNWVRDSSSNSGQGSFSFRTIVLGKGMNPPILLSHKRIIKQNGFFSFSEATRQREWKIWIKTSCTLLKNWLCV